MENKVNIERAHRAFMLSEAIGTSIKSFDNKEAGISYIVNASLQIFKDNNECSDGFGILYKALQMEGGMNKMVEMWVDAPKAKSSGILYDIDEVLEGKRSIYNLPIEERADAIKALPLEEFLIISVARFIAIMEDRIERDNRQC